MSRDDCGCLFYKQEESLNSESIQRLIFFQMEIGEKTIWNENVITKAQKSREILKSSQLEWKVSLEQPLFVS